MEIAIVGLVGVVLGALINGVFSLVQQKASKKASNEKKTMIAYLQQYISLYKLEQLYCKKVAELNREINKLDDSKKYSESDLTVKKDFRRLVENETKVVLKFTEQNASEFITKIN